MWWSRPGRLSVVFCFMSLLRSGVTFSGTQQIGGGSSEVAWNLEAVAGVSLLLFLHLSLFLVVC